MSVLRVEAADEFELADPPADGATALLVEEDNVDVVSVPEPFGPEESRVGPVALLQRVVLVMRHGGQQPGPTYIYLNEYFKDKFMVEFAHSNQSSRIALGKLA